MGVVAQKIAADAYVPNAGQRLFHACPAFECLAHGNRGGGKSLALLAEFARYVGTGFGHQWRGIIFRVEHKDLTNIVNESLEWFPKIAPGGKFLRSADSYRWEWDTGEQLLLRHAKHEADYGRYHGSAYPFLGFEELTEWPDNKLYLKLFTICRSATKGLPRRIRATTNPSGPGHLWVKRRFIDAGPEATLIQDNKGRERAHIQIDLNDNAALLAADPHYRETIRSAAGNDPNVVRAWLEGSWDITSGGMFDDLWSREAHIVKPFDIPSSWYLSRSFDHGQSKPFSVGWWAESDGTGEVGVPHCRGTLFRVSEWYGCVPNEPNTGLRLSDKAIAEGICEREEALARDLNLKARFRPGPADNAIFARDNNATCPADVMAKHGVQWGKSDKSPGSRARGWQLMRNRLGAVIDHDTRERRGIVEEPGLYVFDTCRDFIRTFPSLPRDKKNPDDIDTNVEDHIADEARYRVGMQRVTSEQTQTVGLY